MTLRQMASITFLSSTHARNRFKDFFITKNEKICEGQNDEKSLTGEQLVIPCDP